MDYNKIITESFQIFWRHKALWIMGIVAAMCGQGDAGGFNFNFNQSFSGDNKLPNFNVPPFVRDMAENPIPYVMALVVVILGWWLFSTIVGWIAQGALIGMVDEIDRTGATSLGQGWRVGSERFLSLFAIAILLALPGLILLIPFIIWLVVFFAQIGVMANKNSNEIFNSLAPMLFSTLACLLPLLCLAILLGFAISLLKTISMRSCVLESLGAIDSLKRGWQVIRQNLGYVALTWFLLFVIRSFFGFIIAIPTIIMGLPVVLAVMNNGLSMVSIGLIAIFVVVMTIISGGLGGILTSFNSTLWTKFYKEVVRN